MSAEIAEASQMDLSSSVADADIDKSPQVKKEEGTENSEKTSSIESTEQTQGVSLDSSSLQQEHLHFLTEKCESNEQCKSMNRCQDGECYHEGFLPLKPRVIVGVVLLFIGLSFSSGVGLGGGGIVLPILILVLNFYSHQAIPLSKSIIFSNSFISFLLHLTERHPLKNSVSIDYTVASLLIPGLLMGTIIGVYINKLVQGVLLTCVLSLILLVLSVRMSIKGYNMARYEIAMTSESAPLEESQRELDHNTNNVSQSVYVDNNMSTEVNEEIAKDNQLCPVDRVVFIFLTYLGFLVFILLTNTKMLGDIFSENKCGTPYLLSIVVLDIFLLIMTFFIGHYTIKEFENRKSIGYRFCRFDVNWSSKVILKVVFYGILVGVIAGSLGVGGGVILSPMLLELGVEPLVCSHTTNFLVVFTSSSTLIQFYLQHLLVVDYASFTILIPIFSAIIGVKLMKYLIEKIKKTYPLIVSLALVLITSSVSLFIYGFHRVYTEKNKYKIFYLGEACE